MAARHRGVVSAYYAFARTADDMADDPNLSIIQKLSALDALDNALHSDADFSSNDPALRIAHKLGQIMRERGLPLTLAADLLTAFRVDARNTIIRTVADLRAYCAHSAAPVGRFLLALHNQPNGREASDALCAALQILNHVQDAREDIQTLKRCYIPLEWLNAEGIDLIDLHHHAGHIVHRPDFIPLRDDYLPHHADETAIDLKPRPVDAAKLRACLNKLLDESENLLIMADALPRTVSDRGLAAQSAAILCLARGLLKRLRATDPWLAHIQLHAVDWLAAAAVGTRRWLVHP
jgi:hydroxysqualene synthase